MDEDVTSRTQTLPCDANPMRVELTLLDDEMGFTGLGFGLGLGEFEFGTGGAGARAGRGQSSWSRGERRGMINPYERQVDLEALIRRLGE